MDQISSSLFCLFMLFVASISLAQEKEGEEFKPKIRGVIMMANFTTMPYGIFHFT
jgi:hypothetical protein